MTGPLHWSTLKWMAKSPAHCKYWMGREYPTTAAMQFGSVVNYLVFGVAPRDRPVVVYPGGTNKNGKFSKERRGHAWETFEAENPGTIIVTEKEMPKYQECANAVKNHPDVQKILDGALIEVGQQWEIAGRECAGTPDIVVKDGKLIVADLKVAHTTDPRFFPHHARKMQWPSSLTWYAEPHMRGMRLVGDEIRGDVELLLIAVEPKPPYPVVVYKMEPDAIEAAQKHWWSLWERFWVCADADHWPGYSDARVPLHAPEDHFTIEIDGEEIGV